MPPTIKKITKSARPREKLATLGIENLTDQELMALILGSGHQERNVLSLAKQVVQLIDKSGREVKADQLVKIKGVGQVLAGKILATLEIGYRHFKTDKPTRILHPKDSLKLLEKLRRSQREKLIGIYLNARYEILKQETIAVGGLNTQHIEARDVFSPALKLPCRCLILAHNHPSGSTQPSDDDLKTTSRLQRAGKLFGVSLLDHLIVTKNEYLSFQEAGLL